MLKANLEKVVHHGKRADSIVENMLRHSVKTPASIVPSTLTGWSTSA